MLSRSNWLILGLAVLVAAAGGYAQHRTPSTGSQAILTSDGAMIGQPAPALELADLDGNLHTLEEYRGRRVLINFWASWCLPCLKEMPALVQAQQKFGEHGAIVVGIAMDEPPHVRPFLAAHPVNYPILIGKASQPSTSFEFGDSTGTLPYSVLIDEDGRVLATHNGPLTTTQLERWLAP